MGWHWGILAGSGSGVGSAYDLIGTTTLTNSVQTVTFTGLDAFTNYKHLQLRITSRATTPAAVSANLRMRFNYDIANNSNWSLFYNNGIATSQSTGNNSVNIMAIQNALPAATATTNLWGSVVVDILDFGSSAKRKTWKAVQAVSTEATLPDGQIGIAAGLWSSTTPISTIELSTPTNEFVIGSRFSIYGVK